jgi:hypothetical protein
MTTKITVTLAQDDKNGTDQAMAETIALLVDLGTMPLRKFVLTLECKDEDAAGLRDDIAVALTGRPAGIDATIKRSTEESIVRQRMTKVTPMDRAGWNERTPGEKAMEWLQVREG